MRSAALRVAGQPVRRRPARTGSPGPAAWGWGPFTEVVVPGRDQTRVYRAPGASVTIPIAATFGSGVPGKGLVRILHRGTFVSPATQATIPTESGVLVATEGLAPPGADAGALPGAGGLGGGFGGVPPGGGFGGGVPGGGLAVVTLPALPAAQALPPPELASQPGLTVPEAFKCSSVELGPIPSPLFLGEPFQVRVVGEPAGGTVQWVSTLGTFEAPTSPVTTLTPTATGQGFVDAEYRVVVQGRDTVSRDGRVVAVEPAKVRVRFPQGRAVQVGSGLPVEVEYLAALPDGVQVAISTGPAGAGVTPTTLPGGAAGLVQRVQVTAGAAPSSAVNDLEVTVTSATAPATVLGRGQVTVWRLSPGACPRVPDAVSGDYLVPLTLAPNGLVLTGSTVTVMVSAPGVGTVYSRTSPEAVGDGFLAQWPAASIAAAPFIQAAYQLAWSVAAGGVSTGSVCEVVRPTVTVEEADFASGFDTSTVPSNLATCVDVTPGVLVGQKNLFVLRVGVPNGVAVAATEFIPAITWVEEDPKRARLFGRTAPTVFSATQAVSTIVAQAGVETFNVQDVVQGNVAGKSARLWPSLGPSVPLATVTVEGLPTIPLKVRAHLVVDVSSPTDRTARTSEEVLAAFKTITATRSVNAIWGRQGCIRFDDVEVVTTTVSGNLVAPKNGADIGTLVATDNDSTRINVYFVKRILDNQKTLGIKYPFTGPQATGCTLPLGTAPHGVLVSDDDQRSVSVTIAHEIGHLFTLRHVGTRPDGVTEGCEPNAEETRLMFIVASDQTPPLHDVPHLQVVMTRREREQARRSPGVAGWRQLVAGRSP